MPKRENRSEYLTYYLKEFLGMIQVLKQMGSIQPMEALGCSNIIRKLMLFYPPSIMTTIDQDLLQGYLKEITTLTCHFMKAASQKNTVSE